MEKLPHNVHQMQAYTKFHMIYYLSYSKDKGQINIITSSMTISHQMGSAMEHDSNKNVQGNCHKGRPLH